MEAEECTTRWKSLRDKFVREVKKVKGGDAGSQYTPTWPLYRLLEFLLSTIKHRQ